MAPGDFNGDDLVDGAILANDSEQKELALFVFLCTDEDHIFKWFKLESLDYKSIIYTGVRKIPPQKISYYRDIIDEKKNSIRLSRLRLQISSQTPPHWMDNGKGRYYHPRR